MKVEIPEFKEFPDSNISGRMIVNPYWLEHLLNLFFQGYLGEVWEEVMDTETNHCALIENWGYGIIGQEFNKKHLDLSNSIVPPSNSPSASSHSFGEHNMVLDRDHNSAINIFKLGQELSYVENNSSVPLVQELSMKQESPSFRDG